MQEPQPNPFAPPPARPLTVGRVLLRWLIASLAMFAAIVIVPGIRFEGPGWQVGIVALIFGLFNVLLRPLLVLFTCPLVILTFGLFILVINALLLGLTSAVASQLNIFFEVDGFLNAFLGGLVISIVSSVLSLLSGDSQTVVVRMQGPPDQNQRG